MKISQKMSEMAWPQIERAFQENWLVVIPLGAACKEHGYHLPMNTDLVMAEILTDYVQENYQQVLIAPPIIDSYFPVFVEYSGSLSLSLETSTDLIVQRCMLWFQQGAKRFYIINNGVSTNEPLAAAKTILVKNCPNIVFEYLDLTSYTEDPRLKAILKQKNGTHADELETSMMLYAVPHLVHLEKAIPEDHPKKKGPLTRQVDSKEHTISVSGAWGDPTLATKEKGEMGMTVLKELIDKQLLTFIHHRIHKHDFVKTLEGKEAVLQYKIATSDGKTLDYYRTFVPPELRGRQIGQELVIFALEYAKNNNFKVIPTCPFVKQYIDNHPAYQRLLTGS